VKYFLLYIVREISLINFKRLIGRDRKIVVYVRILYVQKIIEYCTFRD